MSEYKLVVNGFDSGLNELLSSQKYNYRTKKYMNPEKAKNDALFIKNIYGQLPKNLKLKTPIKVKYEIQLKDKRRDRGNYYSAAEKSFLDALQKCKCISNDGFDDVLDSEFHTELNRNLKQNRIEITIKEVKE